MSIKNKSVLVTGGAGFIGSHLVDELIRQGARHVTVVDTLFLGKKENLREARKTKKASLYIHDASDLGYMKRIIHRHKVSIVYNLATKALPYSFVDPNDAYLVNINLSNTLLTLQKSKAFKTLIHFSSSEVYGTSETRVMTESHPMNPRTPYAAGKAAADMQVLSWQKVFGLDIAVVRPFNTYGPRQNQGLYAGIIPITVHRIQKGKAPIIEGAGTQTRDFIYVTDVAKAAIRIYNQPKSRGLVTNIATGKETSVQYIIRSITKQMGYRGKIIRKPERAGDVHRHCAGIARAKQLINFTPSVSFTQGLQKTIDWYNAQIS